MALSGQADARGDLIDGKCIYSEYECVPIIDYTRKHPMFSEAKVIVA